MMVVRKTKTIQTLVGKGLTYDAGGYNIKSNMHGMKYDMCGAANMLCALELLL